LEQDNPNYHAGRDTIWDRIEFPQLSHQKRSDGNQEPTTETWQNATPPTDSVEKRYVTFYFTNVPDMVPYYIVKESFEVCGILDNLFLSRKRNKQGQIYGFARYVNVRDVEKMLKALNNISFGQYCVWAKVARFGRQPLEVVKPSVREVVRGVAVREKEQNRDVRKIMTEGAKFVGEGGQTVTGAVNNIVNVREEARLGKATVKEGGVNVGRPKEVGGAFPQHFATADRGGVVQTKQNLPRPVAKLIRTYKSTTDDLAWASKGLVASVLYGESILVIQNRIADAGFEDIDIIPLGADKVFIRCISNCDVMKTVTEAHDFFNLLFTKPVRWNQNVIKFERGAWVRIYGIPIHAWNSELFKLAIFDCGRFLRLDDSTVAKDRFDYARVLVATSSLEVINFSETILIDEMSVELKIIEEWGFNIGEDDVVSNMSLPDKNYDNMAPDIDNHVDALVNNLADDWATDIHADEGQHSSKFVLCDKDEKENIKAHRVSGSTEATRNLVKAESLQPKVTTDLNGLVNDMKGEQKSSEVKAPAAVMQVEHQPPVVKTTKCSRRQRQHSCPPRATRSINSGPWNIEWLQDQVHGDVGVVSSSKHKSTSKLSFKTKTSNCEVKGNVNKECKSGTRLKHSARNLKKVARLPVDDRKHVLKILMKKVRRCRGATKSVAFTDAIRNGSHVSESSSSASVNNDWKNWVVLRGKDDVVQEDVNCFGKSLGVKLYNDKSNHFRLLSRGRKHKEEIVEEVKEGAQKG